MINENKLKQDIKMIEDSIKKVSHELEMLRSDETQSLRLHAIKHGNHYQYFQREKENL